MAESAIAGCDEFLVSHFEMDRHEPSYTVDTLRYFKESFSTEDGLEFPKLDSGSLATQGVLRGRSIPATVSELFLLLGADMFNDLPNWRRIDEICRLATPLPVFRAGCAAPSIEALSGIVPAERLQEIRRLTVQMPQIELSSSRIRASVLEGKSIRFQVSQSVERYIAAHDLYRRPDGKNV